MLFILLLFLPGRVVAQPYSSDTLSLKVYFPINESSVDYTFGGNGARIREFVRGWNAIKDQSRVQDAVTQGTGANVNKLTYNGGDPVAMTFQHALAWVNFTVKAANVASEAITVNKITVKDGYYEGTFVINVNNYNNATAPTYGDYSWTVDAADKADQDVPGVVAATGVSLDGTGDTGESAKSFGTEGLLLVPTTGITPATASFTNFVINYTLNGNNYDFVYSVAPVLEKGKKYTYAITFTLTEITIAPSIADWTPVDATAVAVPAV